MSSISRSIGYARCSDSCRSADGGWSLRQIPYGYFGPAVGPFGLGRPGNSHGNQARKRGRSGVRSRLYSWRWFEFRPDIFAMGRFSVRSTGVCGHEGLWLVSQGGDFGCSGSVDRAGGVGCGWRCRKHVPGSLSLRQPLGTPHGHSQLKDPILSDGLTCPLTGDHMGVTAERLAQKHGISRAEQDQFAADSHTKAAAAQAAGRFSDEIVPVTVESKRESVKFDADESVRPDVSLQKLAKLPTVFLEGGTVTPGNACPMNDG